MMRNARGFTIIELLATTALASLLMVTVLQVVVMTGRTRDAMDGHSQEDTSWRRQVASLIEADFRSAATVKWLDNQLVIEGWGGWDRESYQAIHEPAIVTYRVTELANTSKHLNQDATNGVTSGVGGGGLVREQRDVADLGQQQAARTLMAIGVDRIAWKEIYSENVPGADDDEAAYQLEIYWADANEPVVIPVPLGTVKLDLQSGGMR